MTARLVCQWLGCRWRYVCALAPGVSLHCCRRCDRLAVERDAP